MPTSVRVCACTGVRTAVCMCACTLVCMHVTCARTRERAVMCMHAHRCVHVSTFRHDARGRGSPGVPRTLGLRPVSGRESV